METNSEHECTNGEDTADRISWHPAFFEAIQLELDEYSGSLQFISEFQLSSEPLRIDLVIIKKTADVPIKKNIARIFRKDNIIEYKSPTDYVSVENFYQVYAYACLYVSQKKAGINDLTLTFVASRYSREFFRHLKEDRGFSLEESAPGVYTIKGDVLPIQIIDSRKLSAAENLWLEGLDNALDPQRMSRVTEEIARQGKAAQIKAYLNAIVRANAEILLEVLKMSTSELTLEKVFEEAGLIEKWEARGEAKGLERGEASKANEIARNMLESGFPVEQVAQLAGLSLEQVHSIAVN
ncbi:MAG: hypothetical protein FWD91_07045 [Treponema sp.]|nr:hypothetical protein [Treponema sp.]